MKFWRNNIALRILFPFLLGIITTVELNINSIIIEYVMYGMVFLFLLSFKISSFSNRKIIGVIILIVLYFIGLEYTSVRTERNRSSHFTNYFQNSNMLKVKVINRLEEKEKTYKTVLKIYSVAGDSVYSCTGKILAYFKKSKFSEEIKYGDILWIKNNITSINKKNNPNQFDYRNYLNLNQINYQVYIDSISILKKGGNTGNILLLFSQKARDKLYGYLKNNGVEGKQLQVGSALLLGYRDHLDKELMQSYSSAGAMHVLAVSGLHVGILYLLLSFVMNWFKRIKYFPYIFALVVISTLWFYALMTGMSASVMRASTMFSFIIIGDKLVKRKISIYNSLAVSAIILMIINPYVIYQVGFQLSYAAVLGIVYIQPKIYKRFYFKNKIADKLWAITCVSIAAQIATAPLSLHYFHQFPTYFLISNLIVIPAASLIFYTGILLFIVAPFGGFSLVLGKILNTVLWLLNQTIYLTENLPSSTVKEISLSIFETYILYLVILLFFVLLYYRKLKWMYLFTGICIGFCVIQLQNQYNSSKQNYITFYSIKYQSVFELVKGKKTYFFSTNKLNKNTSSINFNVQNNWNSHNITKKLFFDLDSLPASFEDEYIFIKNRTIVFGNKTIYYLNKDIIENGEHDVVVVSKNKLSYLKRYLKSNEVKLVLFESGISQKTIDYYSTKVDKSTCELTSLSNEYKTIKLNP